MMIVNGGDLYKIKEVRLFFGMDSSYGNQERHIISQKDTHTSPSRSEHELAASQEYCATLVSSWWTCHKSIKSSFANEP